jgi:hypothetical protein
MPSTAVATVIQMMESVPEPVQNQIVEHLREYLEDLRDEMEWDELVCNTQSQLAAAARQAKQEIAAGYAKPLDYTQ